jgi:hypothetical protein
MTNRDVEKAVRNIRRATRRTFSAEEKISESQEGLSGGGVSGVPMAAICRLLQSDVKQVLQIKNVAPPLR